jgi:hypothetical protein
MRESWRRWLVYGVALGIGVACGSKVGVSREDGGAGVVDLEQELYEWECRCYGPVEGITLEECREIIEMELEGFEGVSDCIDEVLAQMPEARPSFDCQLDAAYDYVDCLNDQGCENTQCADGTPLPEVWVCDGEEDCDDGSDEVDCGPIDEIMCGDGTTIPASWRCDGYADCDDGSDEPSDCPRTCDTQFSDAIGACGESEALDEAISECYGSVDASFPCEDGSVIDGSLVCDGTNDCSGGEDEANC